MDPLHQEHDYNPGIALSGLFRTVPIPPSSVQHDQSTDSTRLFVVDLDVGDYHSIVAALQGGPSVPAALSYEVRWVPDATRREIRNADQRFAGLFTEASATISWQARQAAYEFVSDPPESSRSLYAAVGHERNGSRFTA